MTKNYKYDFHRFTALPQQSSYNNMNLNWTGQTKDVGDPAYGANHDLSPEMKTFYDKALIRLASPKLVYDQFGQKRPIPAGNGKTIEFRQFNPLPKALTPLTEGITPAGQSVGVIAKTATVEQYGAYIATTDMLKLTAFDNTMAEFITLLGEQAGRTSDTITRDEIMKGTNVIFSDADDGGNDARTDLTAADILTISDVKKAVRALKRNNAPKIGNDYVCIIHPDTTYDIWNDPEWVEVAKYGEPTRLFAGEVGRIFGVRFVESTEAKIWKDNTCPSDGSTGYLPVYGSVVLGQNAYGVTSINGGGIETIVKQLGSGGSSDPLKLAA